MSLVKRVETPSKNDNQGSQIPLQDVWRGQQPLPPMPLSCVNEMPCNHTSMHTNDQIIRFSAIIVAYVKPHGASVPSWIMLKIALRTHF